MSRQISAALCAVILSFVALLPALADQAVDPGAITFGSPITSTGLNNRFSPLFLTVNGLLSDYNIKTGAAINPAKLDNTKAYPTILLGTGTTGVSLGNTGDTIPRLSLTSDGYIILGPGGSTAQDVGLFRSGAGTLAVRNAANNADANLTCAGLTASGTVTAPGLSLTSPLGIAGGGTGAGSLTGNGVCVVNSGGTAVITVAPGTAGNTLQSNGSTWISTAPLSVAGGGTGSTSLAGNGFCVTNSGGTAVNALVNGSGATVVGVSSTGPRLLYGNTGISNKAIEMWAPAGDSATVLSTYGGPNSLTAYTAGSNTSGTNMAIGKFVNVVTTTASGNTAGYRTSPLTDTSSGMGPVFTVTVVTPASLTNCRIWAVLTNQDISTSGSTPLFDLAGVRFDTSAGDTHFKFYNDDSSASTVTDSGITPSASTAYTFVVDMSAGSSACTYTILGSDGVTASTSQSVSTHLPRSSVGLGPEVSISTLTTSATQLGIGTMRLETR